MNRAEAREAVRALAVGLSEVDEQAAVGRLMERLANHEAPEELRSLLAEEGARVILRERGDA